MKWSHIWVLAVCVMAGGLCAEGPPAKVPGPKTVADALQQVSSSDYAAREAATEFLLRQPAHVVSDVQEQLKKEAQPETIARLTRVALHLYLKKSTPLAGGRACALGIALDLGTAKVGADERAAIVVLQTQPGFPSAELLRVGDRIIAIDDRELPFGYRLENFVAQINSQPAGTTVTFQVLRGRRKLEIKVPLVSIEEPGQAELYAFIRKREEKSLEFIRQLETAAAGPVRFPGAEPAPPRPGELPD